MTCTIQLKKAETLQQTVDQIQLAAMGVNELRTAGKTIIGKTITGTHLVDSNAFYDVKETILDGLDSVAKFFEEKLVSLVPSLATEDVHAITTSKLARELRNLKPEALEALQEELLRLNEEIAYTASCYAEDNSTIGDLTIYTGEHQTVMPAYMIEAQAKAPHLRA